MTINNGYQYYYNNIPGKGPCRNNLIYTSLISSDQKTFIQWYYNDTDYHRGENEVVDPSKMQEKWLREINYITQMRNNYPDLIPKIINIDLKNRKLHLEIDGPDFWEKAGCLQENFDTVLPDWQDQMLEILQAHKKLGWHKYSVHPNSYHVINGRLKSTNYFFTYRDQDPLVSIKDVESHIHSNRQSEMRKYLDKLGIDWGKPQPWSIMDQLCWESFSTNYPASFIQRVRQVLEI
jgi:hypothetical protein